MAIAGEQLRVGRHGAVACQNLPKYLGLGYEYDEYLSPR